MYAIHEVGSIGSACSHMRDGNRVHLHEDEVAVITRRRIAPLSEVEVNSLLFTPLLPFSPCVLINAEMDDMGVIDDARCDCAYSAIGFRRQIRDIRSYGKLTGQGVTLVGTDIVAIIEEALPGRLGGVPGDYQLVEIEGAIQTELILRVSPRVKISGEHQVKQCFLEELRRCYGGALAARLWQHSDALRVSITEPHATVTGKVLPLHLMTNGSNYALRGQR